MMIAKAYKSSPKGEVPRHKRFILPKLPKRERSNSCDFEAPSSPLPDYKRPRSSTRDTDASSISTDVSEEEKVEVTASNRLGPTAINKGEQPSRLQEISRLTITTFNNHADALRRAL
jgi:hypothetical protein